MHGQGCNDKCLQSFVQNPSATPLPEGGGGPNANRGGFGSIHFVADRCKYLGVGLGWVGLGLVGLGLVGLGLVGLGWVGLGWVGLGWVGWVGLVGLGWQARLDVGWVGWVDRK